MAEDYARDSMAQADCSPALFAELAGMAAGSQRILAPGPGVHRSSAEQEGRCGAHLSAAGCEHAALGGGSLFAQPALHQFDCRGKTACAAMADDGRGRGSLYYGARFVAVGFEWRRRSGDRDGLLRGCAYA